MREQVLPGTEEALKCKARHEEEMRLKAIKVRQQEEVRGLCEMFNNMEPSIIDAVYESCEKHRCSALQQLMDMAGDTPALHNALRAEALRLHSVMLYKKRVVESSLRCPISRRLMKDPVLASDGFSYDRASISSWLADKSTSPVCAPILVETISQRPHVETSVKHHHQQSVKHHHQQSV